MVTIITCGEGSTAHILSRASLVFSNGIYTGMITMSGFIRRARATWMLVVSPTTPRPRRRLGVRPAPHETWFCGRPAAPSWAAHPPLTPTTHFGPFSVRGGLPSLPERPRLVYKVARCAPNNRRGGEDVLKEAIPAEMTVSRK